jgi:hypothetical protein
MTKLLIFVTSTIGGAIGWWMGAFIGIMTAFMISIVGTAAGVYFGRMVAQRYDM